MVVTLSITGDELQRIPKRGKAPQLILACGVGDDQVQWHGDLLGLGLAARIAFGLERGEQAFAVPVRLCRGRIAPRMR